MSAHLAIAEVRPTSVPCRFLTFTEGVTMSVQHPSAESACSHEATSPAAFASRARASAARAAKHHAVTCRRGPPAQGRREGNLYRQKSKEFAASNELTRAILNADEDRPEKQLAEARTLIPAYVPGS